MDENKTGNDENKALSEPQTQQVGTENGKKKTIQNEDVLPRKPGFYKNPTSGSAGTLETNNSYKSGKNVSKSEGKYEKPVVAGSEETVSSSGIDCGVSEKTESITADSNSVESSSNTASRQDGHERVLYLCTRGEWILLDQHLRNLRRAHPSLSKAEPVSLLRRIVPVNYVIFIFYFLKAPCFQVFIIV